MNEREMSQVVLSIAIPAYKYHAGVFRILEKLHDRTDIEVVISEDLPEAESGITNLPNWSNLKYMTNEPALGAVPNWNSVLSHSTGKFVWLIHHDEVPCFPAGLDAFVSFLKQADANILVSHLDKKSDNILKKAIRNDFARRILARLPTSVLFHNFIGSPSNVIVRRELLEAFDDRLRWFVDVEWFFRLFVQSEKIEFSKFYITPFPHSNSIKASLSDQVTEISYSEIDYICRKHELSGLQRWIWRSRAYLRGLFLSNVGHS